MRRMQCFASKYPPLFYPLPVSTLYFVITVIISCFNTCTRLRRAASTRPARARPPSVSRRTSAVCLLLQENVIDGVFVELFLDFGLQTNRMHVFELFHLCFSLSLSRARALFIICLATFISFYICTSFLISAHSISPLLNPVRPILPPHSHSNPHAHTLTRTHFLSLSLLSLSLSLSHSLSRTPTAT